MRKTLLVGFAVVCLLATHPAGAQDSIAEWPGIKLPAVPAIKPVKIENAAETALLVMDFTNQTCSKERRPRCAAQIDGVAKLVAAARAKGALVIFTVATAGSTAKDLVTGLEAKSGETVLPPLGPDKFIGSTLEKDLKDRGIKTVIAMGTQAQTSVLHTGGAAALRGFKVIVPVDAMSADDAFPEAYTAWHMSTASRIGPATTLTRLGMISW